MYKLLSEKEIKKLEKNIDPKTLGDEEFKQYVQSKGKYDKQFFMDYFLRHRQISNWKHFKSPAIHNDIDNSYEKKNDFCLRYPRGHGKTTRILVNIMHELIYYKVDLLYISSEWLGKESVGKIKKELQTNNLIREVFGELVPIWKEKKDSSLKRQEHLLQLKNWSSLETIPKNWSVRGKRKSKIIIDDPQENKDILNQKVVDKFNSFILTSVIGVLLPGGVTIIVWNIISKNCLVKFLVEKSDFEEITVEACDEKYNNWVRPELRTRAELIKKRKKIWKTNFNQEYRNIPMKDGEVIIDETLITYWNPPKEGKVVFGIDPAFSEKTGTDAMALTITKHYKNCFYPIAWIEFKGKQKNEEFFCDKIENRYKKFNCSVVNIEQNNGWIIIARMLKRKKLAVKTFNATKDKVTRLLEFQGAFERGEIIFRDNKSTKKLIDQLVEFPNAKNDDLVDSMVYSFHWHGTAKMRIVKK